MRPKYLYHYTTIDTLALILKNKTIRFNSLMNVDDLEEGKSEDLERAGAYCFISCWTNDSKESIPLWHMYTNEMKGVRIKMPSDMFEKYDVTGPYVAESFKSYFKYEDIFRNNGIVQPGWGNILEKVIYTNDKKLLYPKVINIHENGGEIKLNHVGIYKSEDWTFQQEWRYIIRIYPISINEIQTKQYEKAVERLRSGRGLDIDSYFLKIKNESFEKMEIMLAPNTTEADKIIVESLVNTYNLSAKIVNSTLTNKVKVK